METIGAIIHNVPEVFPLNENSPIECGIAIFSK